jgi:hypothetical protein
MQPIDEIVSSLSIDQVYKYEVSLYRGCNDDQILMLEQFIESRGGKVFTPSGTLRKIVSMTESLKEQVTNRPIVRCVPKRGKTGPNT